MTIYTNPYGYIYETTNLVNGKKYIGQMKYGRKEPYLGSGVALRLAIKKYGPENFSKQIICECDSKEELNKMEIYYIAQTDAVLSDRYYNMAHGGNSIGLKHTKETREKLSEKAKNRSPETRQRMSDAQKGKILSEEHRNKIGAANRNRSTELRQQIGQKLLGRIVSEETRKKLSEHKHTEETKKKISESHKGQKFTEEHRKNISTAAKNRKPKTNLP